MPIRAPRLLDRARTSLDRHATYIVAAFHRRGSQIARTARSEPGSAVGEIADSNHNRNREPPIWALC